MATSSTKDTFEPETFAPNTFLCGTWRGGVADATIIGLEYTLPPGSMPHYTLGKNQTTYALPENIPNYTIPH